MSPIELLKQELDKFVKAKEKSIKALEQGKISIDLHDQHMRNLTPLISEYKYIIEIINTYA